MARVPTMLLKLVGRALVTNLDDSVLNDLTATLPPELASDIWQRWTKQASEAQQREEIQALARVRWEDLEPVVEALVAEVVPSQPNVFQTATSYLMQVPAAICRHLRRPADPEGHTFPAGFTLRHAADLLALLPRQIPWFTPGDRPAEVGDWELVELLDIGGLGETWLARNPRLADVPPALFKFFLNPAAKEKLLRPEILATGSILDRVLQDAQHPGILQLRRLHLNALPPCLQYEYVAGGTLASLIRDWHGGGSPAPAAVVPLVRTLAETLGFLHRLNPPLVHRGLRPTNILVRQDENGNLHTKIMDLGLSQLLPHPVPESARGKPATPDRPEIDPLLYVSPQEQRGEPPHPRDDVYTLGILWYQMLTGNLTAGRPGGSQWRRRLAEQGMAGELIELLEACFEDDPFYRPADAADLAEKLSKLAAPAPKKAARKPSVLDVLQEAEAVEVVAEEEEPRESRPTGRTRQRRSDVWQLFDTLEKKAPEVAKLLTNDLGMKLVLVPAGTFQMGSPPEEAGSRESEWPRHEITLTRAFYMGVTPITQQQYLRVMRVNPARFNLDNGGSAEHPVECVSWEQAVEFCRRLSELPEEKKAGRVYRLPTEAEWEYACRAGTDTPFGFGAALASTQANFDGQFPYGAAATGRVLHKTSRAGQFPPNHFGLHDMHGNVWEWCADWLDTAYYEWSPKRDPKGPGEGRYRVLRGGSWKNHAMTCRSGYRNGLNPRLKDSATGFRVACEV